MMKRTYDTGNSSTRWPTVADAQTSFDGMVRALGAGSTDPQMKQDDRGFWVASVITYEGEPASEIVTGNIADGLARKAA